MFVCVIRNTYTHTQPFCTCVILHVYVLHVYVLPHMYTNNNKFCLRVLLQIIYKLFVTCICFFSHVYKRVHVCLRVILHLYTLHVHKCLCTYTCICGSYTNTIFFRRDTYWGWKFSSIIDCICDVAHVYKNIAAHVDVIYDIYTLSRIRVFCAYTI